MTDNDQKMQATDSVREIDEMLQRAGEMQDAIKRLRLNAVRQEADLRAKAELLERIEGPMEVYGTTDPKELYEAADHYGIVNNGAL
jgi:hypothetical protein